MTEHQASPDDTAAAQLAAEIRRLRRAAGLSQPELAQQIGYTRQYVSLAERIGKNIPSQELVRALDTALNANGSLLILRTRAKAEQHALRTTTAGFVTPTPGIDDDVNRKTFLRAALGVSAGALVARHLPVQDDLAALVAGPTAHYRRMESAVATPDLAPAVDAHLRLASRVVGEELPTPVGFCVLSETAGLAAWLAAVRGDSGMARRHYADPYRYAKRANHPLLAAYMLASLGHFAVESGDPRQGLSLLDRASDEIRGRNASDAARAWLASLRSLAHATTGDRKATLTELRAAEAFSGSDRGDPQWPWVFAFGPSKAARYQASALARLDDLGAARVAFAAAAPCLTSPKPQALAQVDQARALARAGHVAEACALAVDALAVGRGYGSERVIQGVRALRAHLPANSSDTAALDAHLTALYEDER